MTAAFAVVIAGLARPTNSLTESLAGNKWEVSVPAGSSYELFPFFLLLRTQFVHTRGVNGRETFENWLQHIKGRERKVEKKNLKGGQESRGEREGGIPWQS